MTGPGWWACPNDPPCPHSGVIHDIYAPDDPRPVCCADGCQCGKEGRTHDDPGNALHQG